MHAVNHIFDTQAEAEAAQAADFGAWKAAQIAAGNDSAAYWQITTRWAQPQQRATDGRWYYPTCPGGVSAAPSEMYSAEWSAAPEDL